MGQVINMQAARAMSYAFRRFFGAFSGKRNLYDVFGYRDQVTFDDRYLKYLRQDVAARIVDAPAAALWTNPPEIISNDDVWNERWDDLVARYALYANVERVDKLAGIGRYSILLIGFNDGRPLKDPVNTRAITQSKTPILYLQPYSEGTATVKQYNDDPSSEDFMKPLIYTINPMTDFVIGFDNTIKKPVAGSMSTSFEVHASRVVHIAENTLENQVYGSPRMERVFNILDDLLKVTGGSAETFWLTANRGLHIDIDKEMEVEPNDASAIKEEIDEYINNLSRVIRTRGTTVKALGSDSPDPTGTFKMLISVLSGATGIPSRILIGSEAGQLASDQDRANWADRVDERRANFGNPIVLFSLIRKLVKAGFLPSPQELEITINWPSAFKLSPLESAQTSAQHARSATNFAKAIETMENLKRGEPGSEAQLDEGGNPIPGTEKPAVPGMDTHGEELITIPEARKFIGLDKADVTFNSGEDVGGSSNSKPRLPASNPARTFSRKVTVSLSTIMRV